VKRFRLRLSNNSHTMTVKTSRSTKESVSTFKEAAQAVRRHIASTGVGASEWSGGMAGAIIEGSKKIGRVSYNGTVRDIDGLIVNL